MRVKRPGREADHSPPSSADIKKAWSYTFTPQYAFVEWCSVEAQGQLYLYVTFSKYSRGYVYWYADSGILRLVTCSHLSSCLNTDYMEQSPF